MCFSDTLNYRCGHSSVEQKQCEASKTQQRRARPRKKTFWQRLFGRRRKYGKVDCRNISVDRYVDDYCGYCFSAAERQRLSVIAQTNRGRSQEQLADLMREAQTMWSSKIRFRCTKCKSAKRHPRMQQRIANSGLCCANGMDEFKSIHGHLGDPGPDCVQATSSTASGRIHSPSSYGVSGEYGPENMNTQADFSTRAGSPPISQMENPTGIDFERWNTTVRRTNHGSYPAPSSSPPDGPLPTRPLLIRKPAPVGREPSGEQSGRPPSRRPDQAIPSLPPPLPLPPRDSSLRAIYESPKVIRRKPVPNTRGVDAHYHPPPSPPTNRRSQSQLPAVPPVLRRSSQRIEDLQLPTISPGLGPRNPVPVSLPNRHIASQLDVRASQIALAETPRRDSHVLSRLDMHCDEVEALWRRGTDQD